MLSIEFRLLKNGAIGLLDTETAGVYFLNAFAQLSSGLVVGMMLYDVSF